MPLRPFPSCLLSSFSHCPSVSAARPPPPAIGGLRRHGDGEADAAPSRGLMSGIDPCWEADGARARHTVSQLTLAAAEAKQELGGVTPPPPRAV